MKTLPWTRPDLVLCGATLAFCAGMIAGACQACTPASQDVVTASHAADGTAFGLELQACVAQSATAAQYSECRAQVIARWCGDGGAISEQGACSADGGPAR